MPQAIKEEKVGPQWLDRNEQHALIRTVEQGENQRDLTIIQLLLNTGLRVSELCSLMWSDIKITSRKGRLIVRSGKGGKRREIPLNKDARQVLFDLGYPNHKGQKEAIFMGQRGPMTPRGVESMFRKYVAHTELDEVTPHKLRHTFCKNLIEAGVSLEKVALLAGHENLETTRLYCSPCEHDLEAAVDLIGGFK
jgi:integrase/recombinase XerC